VKGQSGYGNRALRNPTIKKRHGGSRRVSDRRSPGCCRRLADAGAVVVNRPAGRRLLKSVKPQASQGLASAGHTPFGVSVTTKIGKTSDLGPLTGSC
jgi:hypothetical protein